MVWGRGPHNQGCSIWGLCWGSQNVGKLASGFGGLRLIGGIGIWGCTVAICMYI